jgi:hypothetical protein
MVSLKNLPREQLLPSLKGKSFVVPDMQALLCDWPQLVNPHLETLYGDVEKYIEMCAIFIS